MSTVVIVYLLLAAALAVSLIKDRDKTKAAFVFAWKALLKTAPAVLGMLGIVGLTLGLLPPETIQKLVGEEAGFAATLIASVIGAITLIPSLIAFPLAGSLLRSGATVMTISAFITTLVMVGVVTAPMEIRTLGRKFTLLRNELGFLSALVIAGIMGVLL
ncbi:MAG: permease [Eubacteriales bacterium]|nr:permease [Eubacteriales bacterium]